MLYQWTFWLEYCCGFNFYTWGHFDLSISVTVMLYQWTFWLQYCCGFGFYTWRPFDLSISVAVMLYQRTFWLEYYCGFGFYSRGPFDLSISVAVILYQWTFWLEYWCGFVFYTWRPFDLSISVAVILYHWTLWLEYFCGSDIIPVDVLTWVLLWLCFLYLGTLALSIAVTLMWQLGSSCPEYWCGSVLMVGVWKFQVLLCLSSVPTWQCGYSAAVPSM